MSDISVAQIKRAVCQEWGTSLIEMTSDRRAKIVARPRQVAMYLTRNLTKASLPAIGRRFGNRDHTTIMAAIRRITALMASDSMFALRVTALEARLQSPELVEHY